MATQIDHIEIEVSDADEMAEFLQLVGFEVIRRTDHHGASYELGPADGDGPFIEIHTVTGEETPGVNHIAFAVDDIETFTERLEDHGVDDLTGPKYFEKTGRTLTNFRDPDGRRFQAVPHQEDQE